jgi:hypothetical protein
MLLFTRYRSIPAPFKFSGVLYEYPAGSVNLTDGSFMAPVAGMYQLSYCVNVISAKINVFVTTYLVRVDGDKPTGHFFRFEPYVSGTGSDATRYHHSVCFEEMLPMSKGSKVHGVILPQQGTVTINWSHSHFGGFLVPGTQKIKFQD